MLQEDGIIPSTQTAAPVGFGELLETLQSDTREDLRDGPRRVRPRRQRQGRPTDTTARSATRSARSATPRSSTTRRGASASTTSPTTSRAPARSRRGSTAIPSSSRRWSPTSRRRPTRSRSRSGISRRRSRELPRTLRTGHAALRELNGAFPPLRRLVADLRPAVRSSGPALDATYPFLRELRGLVSRKRAGRPRERPAPGRAGPRRAQPRRRRAAGGAARAVQLPAQRGAAVAGHDRSPTPLTRPPARSTRRASSGCRASPARAATSTPTASTSAPLRTAPTTPTRRRRALLHHRPADAGRQPAEEGDAAAASRRAVRDAGAAGPAHAHAGAAACDPRRQPSRPPRCAREPRPWRGSKWLGGQLRREGLTKTFKVVSTPLERADLPLLRRAFGKKG